MTKSEEMKREAVKDEVTSPTQLDASQMDAEEDLGTGRGPSRGGGRGRGKAKSKAKSKAKAAPAKAAVALDNDEEEVVAVVVLVVAVVVVVVVVVVILVVVGDGRGGHHPRGQRGSSRLTQGHRLQAAIGRVARGDPGCWRMKVLWTQ